MLIKISQFAGMAPKIDKHLLPASASVLAQNCKMFSGSLRPWGNPVAIATTPNRGSDIKSIYLYQTFWLSWTGDVDVAEGPIANDTYKRLYWTGDGVPKMSTYDLITDGGVNYPNAAYDLGIPAPTSMPTLTLGSPWTEGTGIASANWKAIAYGDGIFVAIAYGSNVSATSPDGVTWTPRTLPSSQQWSSICYGNALFVAVAADSNTAIHSPDGITWTASSALVSAAGWGGVTYGKGLFVAVSDAVTAAAATSTDGATWVSQALPFNSQWQLIAYGNGIFVCSHPLNDDTILTSPDGVTWTVRHLPMSTNWTAITFASTETGLFVLVGKNGVVTSADGIVWTIRTVPQTTVTWGSVSYGGNAIILTDSNGVESAASFDGVTWGRMVFPSTQLWISSAYGNSVTVALAYGAAIAATLPALVITQVESRAYCYRFKSAYREAGPPSPTSAVIDLWPWQSVIIASLDTSVAGNHNITDVEIYRTNTGSQGTAFQFVASIALGTATYTDSLLSASLGEVLDSLLWDGPPADLSGMIALPNGSLCGFSGKSICFSVPYQPHAWPVGQRYPLKDIIVGIGSFGWTVLAATHGKPYAIDLGADLTTLMPSQIENGYSCVSKRGVVDMGGSVAYPEPDGLRSVGVNGSSLVTAKVLDRDSWQALLPATISAYFYAGLYLAFTDAAVFAYNQEGDLVDIIGIAATGGYHDPKTGNLYLAVGQDVLQWDAGAPMSYNWVSRPFVAARPTNMTCAQVYADAFPATLQLHVDGALKATITVPDNTPQRLPVGYRGVEFTVTVSGTANVYDVFLAGCIEELRRTA